MTEDRKNVVDLVDAAPRQFSNALARKHFRHLSEAQTPHANTRYQYKLTRAHEWSRQYYEAENFLRRAFILCLFLVVWPGIGRAEESLGKAIKKVTRQDHFKHAHWGALFVDRASGDVVFEHAVDKLFAPASTTKLFSERSKQSDRAAARSFALTHDRPDVIRLLGVVRDDGAITQR